MSLNYLESECLKGNLRPYLLNAQMTSTLLPVPSSVEIWWDMTWDSASSVVTPMAEFTPWGVVHCFLTPYLMEGSEGGLDLLN